MREPRDLEKLEHDFGEDTGCPRSEIVASVGAIWPHSQAHSSRDHIAMADQKLPEYDLPADLVFPVQMVDPLSVIQEAERGNTPRPSRARLSFVSGVSAIQKKQFENAFKQVRRYFLMRTTSDRREARSK